MITCNIDTDDMDCLLKNSLQQGKHNMMKNKSMGQKKAADWNELWNVGGHIRE